MNVYSIEATRSVIEKAEVFFVAESAEEAQAQAELILGEMDYDTWDSEYSTEVLATLPAKRIEATQTGMNVAWVANDGRLWVGIDGGLGEVYNQRPANLKDVPGFRKEG